MKGYLWAILLAFIVFLLGMAYAEDTFIYNPEGLRDPFASFLRKEEPVKPEGVGTSPLQQYELSQLKLVAIIVGEGGDMAMVEDSEGKGYIIKEADYIGNRFGRVKDILPGRVIVEETYKDILGQLKRRQIVLDLHPEESKER